MANLIIQENGAARTRPAVTGEEITIKTPCSCSDVTGVQINGVVFPFYDAMGNSLGDTAGLFNKGSLIRVLIDADNTRAYILNADTNAYLEGELAKKYSPTNKPSASDITSGTLSSDRLPTVPVTKGGTNATTPAGARANLGIPTITCGPEDPSGGSDGDIYFQYTT